MSRVDSIERSRGKAGLRFIDRNNAPFRGDDNNKQRRTTIDTIKTNNVKIPRLGFGTFRMPRGDRQPVVESALALGYRHNFQV